MLRFCVSLAILAGSVLLFCAISLGSRAGLAQLESVVHNESNLRNFHPIGQCIDGMERIMTAAGFDLFVHCASVDQYVSQSLKRDQQTVRETREFLAASAKSNTLQRRSVFIDVGANIGYYSVFMALQGCNVVAFEPLKTNLRVLRKNLQLHGLEHVQTATRGVVTVVEAAASEKEGEAVLHLTPNSPGASTLASKTDKMPWKMKVETETIRQCNGFSELKKVLHTDKPVADVVKVDVEGFELAALKGLQVQQLEVKAMSTEFFPSLIRANDMKPEDYLQYLSDQGFTLSKKGGDLRDCNDADCTKAVLHPSQFTKFTQGLAAGHPADLYCTRTTPHADIN